MTDDTAHPDGDDRELLEVEALLRSLTEDDLAAPEPPPASVWAGIQAELRARGLTVTDPVSVGRARQAFLDDPRPSRLVHELADPSRQRVRVVRAIADLLGAPRARQTANI